MILWRAKLLYWTLLSMLVLLACGFQTVLWFQFTGSAASPQLWLNVLLYLLLYRRWQESFFAVYGFGFLASQFSSSSLQVLWPTLFVCSCLTIFIRRRFFWSTTRYFLAAGFAFTAVYNISYFSISSILEANPAPISFWLRFLEVLLTGLWAPPFYWLLQWYDQQFATEASPASMGAAE